MDPEELQGVLRIIGVMSNTIQALKDKVLLLSAENKRLKEKYEPDSDSSEVVHSSNGAADYDPGTPPAGGVSDGGGSQGSDPILEFAPSSESS